MTAKQLDLGTHRFSIEAYHRMGEANVFEGQKVELLCSKIFDMSPISSKHPGLVKLPERQIEQYLSPSETGYKHTQIWRPGDFAESVDGLLRARHRALPMPLPC